MTPESSTILLLVFLAAAIMVSVVLVCRTALFGFALLHMVFIGATALLAYLLTAVFSLSDDWITPAHFVVFEYVAWGLLAIAIATALAWRPMARAAGSRPARGGLEGMLRNAPWVNDRFALFCVVVGAVASLLEPFIFSIPTVGAIWHHLTGFLRIGVIVALVHGMRTGRRQLFYRSLILLLFVGVLSALATGHIGVLWTGSLQLGLVAALGLRTRLRRVLLAAVLVVPALALYVGWLDTRGLIRQGTLSEYDRAEAAAILVNRLVKAGNPFTLTAPRVRDAVLDRLDASEILAAQVEYQPEQEPYAYGSTVTSDLASALIPRFLWPEKPVRAGGSAFVTRFTGLTFASGTSVGLPYPFELFANGGPYLVVGGLFLLGWLIARTELALFAPHQSLGRLLSLFLVVIVLSAGGERFHLTLMSLVTGLAATYGLGRIVGVAFPEYARNLLGQTGPAIRDEPRSRPPRMGPWIPRTPSVAPRPPG